MRREWRNRLPGPCESLGSRIGLLNSRLKRPRIPAESTPSGSSFAVPWPWLCKPMKRYEAEAAVWEALFGYGECASRSAALRLMPGMLNMAPRWL